MKKRDGFNISLWQGASHSYQPNVSELPLKTFDVAIIGGSITGITTALQLQKQEKHWG